MYNLLAANLHDVNAHDLASSLCLIGNFFRLPGKNRFLQTDNRFWKKSGFNIPNHKIEFFTFIQTCFVIATWYDVLEIVP